MKLQRREKILAYSTGGLVLAVIGWFLLLGGDSRPIAKLREERDRLAGEVESKQKLMTAAARDAKQLADWRHRSLPSDPAIARSLYQNWLRGLANRDNFHQLNLESKEIEVRHGVLARISCSIHAHVELGDLAQFLYEFYCAGHLHQIRQMDLRPVENGRELDVNLSIEAMSLPGADSKDQLCKEPGHVLRLAKLADYRQPIAKRNLFVPFRPVAVAAGTVDAAEFAFVTAFVEAGGVRQVWIQDRMAGKTWQLREGEAFQVGSFHGTVRSLNAPNEVVVELDGHRRRLRDGDNLRGGADVP